MSDKYDEMARKVVYELTDRPLVYVVASALRQVAQEKERETASRKPDGYAYIYPWPFGGEVIRFSNGEEYNGHKPLRAVPYWLESSPPSPTPTEDVPTPTELVDREYVRVPMEPTLEMMRAAAELVGYPGTKEKYIAMIQAAEKGE